MEKTEKINSAKEYVQKAEWFRSEYFIDPKTGDVYDYWRPNIYRVIKGLDRFIEAQEHNNAYQQALSEIKAGKIQTRWMWFIFPIMLGLFNSEKDSFFGFPHPGEVQDFWENQILRERLIEATEAVYYNEKTAYEIFGRVTIRFYYCMKLFASSVDHPLFKKVLHKYAWN